MSYEKLQEVAISLQRLKTDNSARLFVSAGQDGSYEYTYSEMLDQMAKVLNKARDVRDGPKYSSQRSVWESRRRRIVFHYATGPSELVVLAVDLERGGEEFLYVNTSTLELRVDGGVTRGRPILDLLLLAVMYLAYDEVQVADCVTNEFKSGEQRMTTHATSVLERLKTLFGFGGDL